MKCVDVQKDLRRLADKKQAANLQGFFKTGDGEYGAGDIFLGLKVPQVRLLVKKYNILPLVEVEKLLQSEIHEERQCALFILNHQFAMADLSLREKIFKLYLKNAKRVNNWDLVDGSAPYIVGAFLFECSKKEVCETLTRLVKSKNLWERRIAVLATFWFIKNKKFDEALFVAESLLNDEHDLIHKAVGWMLREVGKRSLKVETDFLDKYFKKMPRTMLRYAIEKFSGEERNGYLAC